MKVMAIDFGLSRCGVAIGDTTLGIAFERDLLKNTGDLFEQIAIFCLVEKIERIIIGLPKFLNNRISDQTNLTQNFGEQLNEYLNKKFEQKPEIVFFDERYSSAEAIKQLKAQNGKYFVNRKDSLAAMNILQNYFESNNIS